MTARNSNSKSALKFLPNDVRWRIFLLRFFFLEEMNPSDTLYIFLCVSDEGIDWYSLTFGNSRKWHFSRVMSRILPFFNVPLPTYLHSSPFHLCPVTPNRCIDSSFTFNTVTQLYKPRIIFPESRSKSERNLNAGNQVPFDTQPHSLVQLCPSSRGWRSSLFILRSHSSFRALRAEWRDWFSALTALSLEYLVPRDFVNWRRWYLNFTRSLAGQSDARKQAKWREHVNIPDVS